MDKCRICLKYRKNLRLLNETDGDMSYVDMITSVANVKIIKEDENKDKLCLACQKKLREVYDFKILIETSDAALHESNNLKRINFSNINDIKIKIELTETNNNYTIPIDITETFKSGDRCISYNDTVIKKVVCGDEKENKPLCVLDFLKSIKAEPGHDDFDYEVDIGDYESDIEKHDEYKLRQPQKNKKKQFKCKDSKECATPIKPVYLGDVMVVRHDPTMPKIKKKYMSSKLRKDICPYCGKLTQSLKIHILVHIGERKFKCDICSKGFFDQGTLRTHRKRHSTIKNFKCDQCIAAFISQPSLNSHMTRHKDERNYICNVCSKAFKRKNTLARHLMSHNFANKSFKCDMCSMSFYTKPNLTHHIRVHTGERPYNCEICSQPYSYKHDFNRHCMKKHGVFLKRRSVNVMNEEVLMQERALMRDLLMRTQGIVKDDTPLHPFVGPSGALALEQAVKALEARQILVDII